MKATLRADIPFEQYVRADAVNWSSLKHMRTSPLHYRYHLDHPTESTTGQLRGRLLHHLVFEPEKVEASYAIYTGEKNRSSNEYKAFESANPGRCILKADEVAEVRAQAAAVRAHPAVRPYLDGGVFEASMRWTDATTGLACKGRVDLWHPPTRTLIDLKGSTTVDEQRAARVAATAGYVHQLAHYAAGIRACTGAAPTKAALLLVESKPPHDVALFVVSPTQLESAAAEVTELLREVARCQLLGQWPGRYTQEEPLWEFSGEPKITFIEE